MIPAVPYRSLADLRSAAEEVLDAHQRDRSLPIPIELLVERTYGLDVIPIPGFHGSTRVDGALSVDLSCG